MAVKRVTVRFATNRNHIGGDHVFGNDIADRDDPKKYRTGSIVMANVKPALPDNGWEPMAGSLVLDPEAEGDTRRLEARTRAESAPARNTGILRFLDELASPVREVVSPRRESARARSAPFGVILLPGFASTFRDAMRRAAQVATAYGASDVFCFSWPANGRVSPDDYRDDQRDARDSAKSIALSLARLLEKTQQLGAATPRLEIVAHSMGNYALRHAIHHIEAAAPGLIAQTPFEGAFLMAADDDFDTLNKADKLGPLVGMCKRVTVYTADEDRALMVSALVNGFARLGIWGPKDPAALPAKVTRIDVTSHSSTVGDFGESHHRHQYYRLSKGVIADVKQVLAGKAANKVKPRNPHPGGAHGGRAWKVPFFQT